MFIGNAHLYPPPTHTRIHHVLPSVITSIAHPYLPPSRTRINFPLPPVSTSLSHSLCPLKWRLTEQRNDDWQLEEMMEEGRMKRRNRNFFRRLTLLNRFAHFHALQSMSFSLFGKNIPYYMNCGNNVPKIADIFSSVWFSPCLWRFCLTPGLETLDITCMQTPSPYPVRSRGFDLSITEEC